VLYFWQKITGHKHVFEHYNAKTTEDIRGAFIKVDQFSSRAMVRSPRLLKRRVQDNIQTAALWCKG
jgi:hypothetical protein